jgi:universal stress protein E
MLGRVHAGNATMSHAIRRILVAVKDPSVKECPAARKAAQLARGLEAELCLYHALTGPLYVDVTSLSKAPATRAEEVTRATVTEQLEKMAAPLRSGKLKVTTEVNWDYPSQDAVIRAALRLKADLVVVDCPRHAHTAAWFLHFTDWELVRKCPIPILLVKNRTDYLRAPVLAALDPNYTEGKPPSLDLYILDYGTTLASALGDHVHAVHAFNPIGDLTAGQSLIPQLVAEAEQEAYSIAHNSLDPLLDQIGVQQSRRHIEEGFPIDVIERVLQRSGAQILVMGSVSRTGLKGLMIGNTAERMLDRVTCDLLVVKPPDFLNTIPQVSRGAKVVPRPALAAAVLAIA